MMRTTAAGYRAKSVGRVLSDPPGSRHVHDGAAVGRVLSDPPVVIEERATRQPRGAPRAPRLLACAVGAAALALAWAPALSASAPPSALAAWHSYVGRAARHVHERPVHDLEGMSTDVPGGTIHHWRGATLVAGVTVDEVVHRLLHPGTPPPQDDVLESRVLARDGSTLRVYLKLARTAIVTVVYDTEHDVTFVRHSPGVATSRSVSTRIVEAGGRDRGFLWRLNSYWRYTQSGDAVRIEVESLSLSRDVPWFARAVASPIADRIARESLARTLDSVRRYLDLM